MLGTRLAGPPIVETVRRIRALPPTRGVSILAIVPAGEALRARGRPRRRGSQRRAAPARRAGPPRVVDRQAPLGARAASSRGFRSQGEVVGSTRSGPAGHFFGLTLNLSVHGMLLASPLRMEPGTRPRPRVPPARRRAADPRARAASFVRRPRSPGPTSATAIEFLYVPPDGTRSHRQTSSSARRRCRSPRRLAPRHDPARTLGVRDRRARAAMRPDSSSRSAARPGTSGVPGNAGPFYVVEGASPEAALGERPVAFVHRQA